MLSNYDIMDMLDGIKAFKGVFSRDDKIADKIGKEEYGVVNLDSSSGPGTHWVCYLNSKRLPFAFYYDSFGLSPPEETAAYLRTAGKKMLFNSSQIQSMTSIMCGYYCVDIIKRFAAGESLIDILYSYKQEPSEYNEDLIKSKF